MAAVAGLSGANRYVRGKVRGNLKLKDKVAFHRIDLSVEVGLIPSTTESGRETEVT